MAENTVEQLTPPSQETLDSISDRVMDLTRNGYQPRDTKFKMKTLDEPDGHRVNLTCMNEEGEILYPNRPLITIVISDMKGKDEGLSYSLYKDIESGKKRIEKNGPRPKPSSFGGSKEEQLAQIRQAMENVRGVMEDVEIRRYRGLSAIDQSEAVKLLQRLNSLVEIS